MRAGSRDLLFAWHLEDLGALAVSVSDGSLGDEGLSEELSAVPSSELEEEELSVGASFWGCRVGFLHTQRFLGAPADGAARCSVVLSISWAREASSANAVPK